MNDGSKSILVVLLMLSVIFNFYAFINKGEVGTSANPTDNVVISVDKLGKINIAGPNGSKPIKVIDVGSKGPVDILKITGGKPVKSLDSITIFSYNPTCYKIGGIVRCYNY